MLHDHYHCDHHDDHLDCDCQVLGLTVRVLEDLPLLLNPLAILTLRSIIITVVTMATTKIMMKKTMMMIFQAWAGQARTKERKLIAGRIPNPYQLPINFDMSLHMLRAYVSYPPPELP